MNRTDSWLQNNEHHLFNSYSTFWRKDHDPYGDMNAMQVIHKVQPVFCDSGLLAGVGEETLLCEEPSSKYFLLKTKGKKKKS